MKLQKTYTFYHEKWNRIRNRLSDQRLKDPWKNKSFEAFYEDISDELTNHLETRNERISIILTSNSDKAWKQFTNAIRLAK